MSELHSPASTEPQQGATAGDTKTEDETEGEAEAPAGREQVCESPEKIQSTSTEDLPDFLETAIASGGVVSAVAQPGNEEQEEVQPSAEEASEKPVAPAACAATTTNSELPADWTEHMDPASQRVYYYHSKTGETRWDMPVEAHPPPVDSNSPQPPEDKLMAKLVDFYGEVDPSKVILRDWPYTVHLLYLGVHYHQATMEIVKELFEKVRGLLFYLHQANKYPLISFWFKLRILEFYAQFVSFTTHSYFSA
jgi:hypothetical protein